MDNKPGYNPKIHNRQTLRLKGYDYGKAGLYFITVCCQDKICRFGHIENSKMVLNEYGQIAHNEWEKLADRFPNFILDEFQIMPNHMHSIIALKNHVGAGFTPSLTKPNETDDQRENDIRRATARVAPTDAPTISDVMGAYKSLVANACLEIYKSKNEIMGKLWQRNYYERIIRSEKAYNNISNYIRNNPAKWDSDDFNIKLPD